MHKALRKIFTMSSAVLTLASIGTATGNATVNAKRRPTRTHRVYRHRRKAKRTRKGRRIIKRRRKAPRRQTRRRIRGRRKGLRRHRYNRHRNTARQNKALYRKGYTLGKKIVQRKLAKNPYQDANQSEYGFSTVIKNKDILNKLFDQGLMAGYVKSYKSFDIPKKGKYIDIEGFHLTIQNAKTYLTTHNMKLKDHLSDYYYVNPKQAEKFLDDPHNEKLYMSMLKKDPQNIIQAYMNNGAGDMGGSDEIEKQEMAANRAEIKYFNHQVNKYRRNFLRHQAYYMFLK